MTAIRKHLRDFIAVVVLFAIALGVAGYILSNQRLTLPGWVPLVGKTFFTLKAEFPTAQAVTPGQGQTVDIAGVKVGEISDVQLKGGRAVVTMKIDKKYSAVYPDAHMLLRPKTGLKDMIVEMDPGTPDSSQPDNGKVKSGFTVPISNTLPDVNLDEVLSALDGDSRQFLQLLVTGAGEGTRGQGKQLAATFKRFDPTARDVQKITRNLAVRRTNIRRTIHNFQLLSTALGGKDKQLGEFVDSSNAVFQAFANQDQNLRTALQLLPGTLSTTQTALRKADTLATHLGPTFQALRPGARALGPALAGTRPFLRETTPIIKNQLRPLSRAALPFAKQLRPAATDLAALTPDLIKVFGVVNYLVNELAYNPPGAASEGYLFWASWANHAGDSVFNIQDAHGPIRRGEFLVSCSGLAVLDQVASANPALKTLVELTNAPRRSDVCPGQAGPGQTGASTGIAGTGIGPNLPLPTIP